MSDDFQIERLTKAYAKLERLYRLPQIMLLAFTVLLGLSNALLSLLRGPPWGPVDALRFGSMTLLGLAGCYGTATLYRVWRKQNAEIAGLYRQLTEMTKMVNSWKPLFTMIKEAHGEGRAVVIQPAEPYQMGRPPEKLN